MESLDIRYHLVIYVPEALLKIVLDLFLPFNFVFVYLSVFKHFTVVAGVGSSLNAHNKRAQV